MSLTKTEIVALLEAEGLRPSRRRGQNFLIDGNLLRLIAEAPALADTDVLLEVGTGLGQLTRLLAERAGRVVTVEVDQGLVGLLRRLLVDLSNVDLLTGSALTSQRTISPAVTAAVRAAQATGPGGRFRVVANPPYSIATPLVLACLDADPRPFDLHLTLQRELAERLASAPGTKAYGAASVMVQARAEVSVLRAIPASAFWPRPRVDSALVRILPQPALEDRVHDLRALRHLVVGLFQARRKAIHNGLGRQVGKAEGSRILAQLGLDPMLRPDAISVADFIALANALPEAAS